MGAYETEQLAYNSFCFIDGEWIKSASEQSFNVENPATEEILYTAPIGCVEDVNLAVLAASRAAYDFASTSREERLALLERIAQIYSRRLKEIGGIISTEIGAPLAFAISAQAGSGLGHVHAVSKALQTLNFQEDRGGTRIVHESIGVAGLITPWNWPMNQMMCKVAAAVAAGVTMVLKPSEYAVGAARILTEILLEAGIPDGAFNLVHGRGEIVGSALAAHQLVDVVSITGSTRAGVEVARTAAPSVKRVLQELGGKSANILLPDVDLEAYVAQAVDYCFGNSGQSCNAPSRLFVHRSQLSQVEEIAVAATAKVKVGDPRDPLTNMGPLVSRRQFEHVTKCIEAGIADGARILTGGLGRPSNLDRGHFVRPTIFSNVRNDMRIARMEIFGPVLSILVYDEVDEAIAMANDSDYGLAAFVSSADHETALNVASKLRAGMVHIGKAGIDTNAPFGGYKRSGNGREFGEFGIREFLEVKAIMGANVVAT